MDQYVDVTTLYTVGDNVKSMELVLSQQLKLFGNWCSKNKLTITVNKTKSMVICSRQKRKYLQKPKLSLYLNGSDIERVTKHKY